MGNNAPRSNYIGDLLSQQTEKQVGYYDILVLIFLGFYKHDVNQAWMGKACDRPLPTYATLHVYV